MATTRVASSQEFDAGRGHTDKVQVRKTCCGPSLGLWMPVESRTPSGLVFAAAARRSAVAALAAVCVASAHARGAVTTVVKVAQSRPATLPASVPLQFASDSLAGRSRA